MESAFFTLWFTVLGVIISGATGALDDAASFFPVLLQAFLAFIVSLIGA